MAATGGYRNMEEVMKLFAFTVVIVCAVINVMTTSVDAVETLAARQTSAQVLIAAR